MNELTTEAKKLLKNLRSEGMSSPAGMHWQRFYELLHSKQRLGHSELPVPLILAASGESNAIKHTRLVMQLNWAMENDCLEEALVFLKNLSDESWNKSLIDQWDEESY